MIVPVAPVYPPHMEKEESRKRLEWHRERIKKEKERLRTEQPIVDYWERTKYGR